MHKLAVTDLKHKLAKRATLWLKRQIDYREKNNGAQERT